jgi:hypothetical protein
MSRDANELLLTKEPFQSLFTNSIFNSFWEQNERVWRGM